MSKSRDVAEAKANEVAVVDVDEWGEYAGSGMESVGASDMLVPRLAILESLSPQLNERKPEYIDGAKSGMIADLGAGEVFPDGVLFLPVLYRKSYIQWAPRNSGRGIVEIHESASILNHCSQNDRRQMILPNGDQIIETAQFYGLNLSAKRRWSFIPMASTRLKRARKWITLARSEVLTRKDGTEFIAPLFYRSYQLTTAVESNNDGEWSSWVITRGPSLSELGDDKVARLIKEDALDFKASLDAGLARGDVGENPEESVEEAAM